MAALVVLVLFLLLRSPPGTPQNTPKAPQNTPKTSGIGSGTPKNPPETPQNTPKTPQNSPNSPQNSPNSPQKSPKNTQNAPKSPETPPGTPQEPPENERLLVVTVATEATDGYRRFLRSARAFNYSVMTLGLGRRWRGGDLSRSPGGGQKVRELRGAVRGLRGRGGLVLLFVDSYDVVFSGGPQELLAKFLGSRAGVLFAAEAFCWPQEGLRGLYPRPPPGGKPFLNSGGFIGYAPALWGLVERWHFRDDDDDQLFYTRLYLDPEIRDELGLALDHHSQIFQNLNGALEEVVLEFQPGGNRVRNVESGTLPVVIHGNGPTKVQLNWLGNYVPGGWGLGGCGSCDTDLRPLGGQPAEALPWVLVGVFVSQPTPFLPQFLRRLRSLRYPRSRMGLFLHNSVPHHSPQIEALWPRLRRSFSSAHWERAGLGGGAARELGMSRCRSDPRCDHYLSLDADVTLTQPGVLRALLEQNRQVLAPLLTRPGQLWSNFWGALSPDGFYARAPDYVELVTGRRRGVWNVPYVSHAYLVGGAALRGPLGEGPVFDHAHLDPDMAFCARAREQGLFLHVTNREHFGHLVVTNGYNVSRRHPELWERPRNPWDWDQLYVHPNYSLVLERDPPPGLLLEPCPDVFQFPLFSEQLGRDLREEAELRAGWAEHHQEWSRGVSLAQLELEVVFGGALRDLLPPIARRLFPGYAPKGRTVLSSVVRYDPAPSDHAQSDPAPQTPPRPSATISLSVSLSPAQGGGWHFPRYSCGAPAPPPGWALLHPGRLTHLPRGVPPKRGPRYGLEVLLDP